MRKYVVYRNFFQMSRVCHLVGNVRCGSFRLGFR